MCRIFESGDRISWVQFNQLNGPDENEARGLTRLSSSTEQNEHAGEVFLNIIIMFPCQDS